MTFLPIRLLSLCWTSGLVERVDWRIRSLASLVLCDKYMLAFFEQKNSTTVPWIEHSKDSGDWRAFQGKGYSDFLWENSPLLRLLEMLVFQESIQTNSTDDFFCPRSPCHPKRSYVFSFFLVSVIRNALSLEKKKIPTILPSLLQQMHSAEYCEC